MRNPFKSSRLAACLVATMVLAVAAMPALAIGQPTIPATAPPGFAWGAVLQLAQQTHLTQLLAGVLVTYILQGVKAVTVLDPITTSGLRLLGAFLSLALGIVTLFLGGDVTAIDPLTLVTAFLDAVLVFGASVVTYHGVAKPANDKPAA